MSDDEYEGKKIVFFFRIKVNSNVKSMKKLLHELLLENIGKHSEAVTRTCSVKEMFLEISQNSQKNTCVTVSLKQTWKP